MMENTVLKEDILKESGKQPVLFEFGLKRLIRAKSAALIELRELELKLINAKHELAKEERNLLLNTNFKELGLTNEKMRNAYVNEQLNDDNIKIDVNSNHNYIVGNLGKGVVITGKSPDEVPEILEVPSYNKFLLAVQWNPEFISTNADKKIIKSFCNAVENNI